MVSNYQRCLVWDIEEVFRALKSDGMRLEETQMHQAERLFKLAVVGLAACRTIQLVDARNGGMRQKHTTAHPSGSTSDAKNRTRAIQSNRRPTSQREASKVIATNSFPTR
jgi:hypothetical protein